MTWRPLASGVGALTLSLLSTQCHKDPPALATSVVGPVDQSNMPPWDGAWTIIGRAAPVARLTQTFTPVASRLTAVEIDIMTGNAGRGGDVVTASIIDGDRVIVTSSKVVDEGYAGLLQFTFGPGGVAVVPGRQLLLRVEDTNKDVLGWRYGLDSYPGGVAWFNGAPWNGGAFDFRFRTYGP